MKTEVYEDINIKYIFDYKALVFISVLLYFAPFEFIAAYILAASAHELGHIISLKIFRKKIYALRFELFGLVIEHEGKMPALYTYIAAAAGPAMGLLYAYTASYISRFFLPDVMSLSSGLSMILSFFNSLPVFPLDGAIMLESVCSILEVKKPVMVVHITGIIVSVTIFAAGSCFMLCGSGCGLMIMGLILLLCTLFEEGIVKRGDLR